MPRVKNSNWRLEARLILDRLEADPKAKSISLAELAKEVGVSRQTVWRDKELLFRAESILKQKSAQTDTKRKRASLEMRLVKMKLDFQVLEAENANLVRCLVEIYKNLEDAGLNPMLYIPQDASSPHDAAVKYL